MMQKRNILIAVALIVLGACNIKTTTNNTRQPIKYRLQAGANKGGITENTNLKLVEGASIDAFSGATKTGFNISARCVIPLKRNAVETGLDFMYNNQTFTYSDIVNSHTGKRTIGTSQIMLPVLYSIPLFRTTRADGFAQLKLGYLAQVNLYNITNSTTTLPKYNVKRFTNGLTIGLSSTPIILKTGSKIGLYVEAYRGTQAYEDQYNLKEFETAGTSFLKYGIVYEF